MAHSQGGCNSRFNWKVYWSIDFYDSYVHRGGWSSYVLSEVSGALE